MRMFDFFRKKKISKYVLAARSYVSSTFKPEPPSDKEEGVKYSHRNVSYSLPKVPPETKEQEVKQPKIQYSLSDLPKDKESESQYSRTDSDIRYSDRGSVRYSDRYSIDDIPNSGDRFASSSVRTFLSQNTTSPSLSRMVRQLDNYLDLTFVDMLTRYINIKVR